MKNKELDNAIIIANGDMPRRSNITMLRKLGFTTLVCADGGLKVAAQLDLLPNVIIGDFDSSAPELREQYSGKSTLLYNKDQDTTDIEKALDYLLEERCNSVVLMAAIGSRLDHSLGNISILLKYADRLRLFLVHGSSLLTHITGEVIFSSQPGEIISLYGFDQKTRFTTIGLKYPLKNEPVPFGIRESTSNVAEGERVSVKVTGGIGIIVRDLKTALKNNFLLCFG